MREISDRHVDNVPDRTPDASPDRRVPLDPPPPWEANEYPNVVEFLIDRGYGSEARGPEVHENHEERPAAAPEPSADRDRPPVERPPSLETVDKMFPGLYDRSACEPPREVDRHRPPLHWAADLNPGYPHDRGRRVNCGDCSRASESTWRGIRTQAGALADPTTGGEPLEVMDTWSSGDRLPTNFDDIEARLTAIGAGSSAIVGVDWKAGGGHWFNAVNDEGVVKAVDSQRGRSETWPPTTQGLGFDEARCKSVDVIFIDPNGKHLRHDQRRESDDPRS